MFVRTDAKSTTQHEMKMFDVWSDQLERKITDPGKKSDLVITLHEIAERIHRRSLVVIFSDMLDNADHSVDEIFSALQHLKHNKHEVILFHVLDKKTETDFSFENKPYRFVDMETGEEVKLNPEQYKKELADQLQNRLTDLKVKCGQYKIDFVEVDINKSFDNVLLPFLIKRKKLY